MNLSLSVLGLVIGLLVGLTGMGGGALMTPALILLGLSRPAIAVGTDLAWSTLTKAVGAVVHARQKTIDWTIVRRLAMGSGPGALLGLVLLNHLNSRGSEVMDRVLVRMLAVALICVSLSLFVRAVRGSRRDETHTPAHQRGPAWLTSLVGAVIGFLVSLTSVGSGSLIVASLVVLHPFTPMRKIVGSDMVHALLLVGLSTLGHLGIRNIDFHLLGALLVGSLPGVWIGGRISAVFPERILQPILATALLFLGYKLF
jgi:uncharacterized membrane protein YfcA